MQKRLDGKLKLIRIGTSGSGSVPLLGANPAFDLLNPIFMMS
jgi:hypothetical protein